MAGVIDNAWAEIRAGRAAQATALLRKHLAVRPKDADAWLVLSHACLGGGDVAAALASAQRAAVLVPQAAAAWAAVAAAGLMSGDEAGGGAAFERAAAIAPADAAVYRAWGDALIKSFRQDEAVRVLQRGVEHAGDDAGLLLSLCYAINVAGRATPREEREWHERLARASGFGEPSARATDAMPAREARDAGMPLRVAILSADFREHSCAFFLEKPLGAIDPARVSLYLYSTTGAPDATTQRFRALGVWRECGTMTPDQLAAQARADAIDVLIDANAWTVPSHMPALARRLAPVQVTYLGYPATTGLGAMDRRIVDDITDPAGSDDACSERLLRVPGCFVCFGAGADWPEPRATAYQRGEGAPVFGSFNNAAKISPGVVEVWSRVLRETPGAKLVLKAAGLKGAAGERLRDRFASRGIGRERLEFRAFTQTTREHVDLYSRVDVALDPFPYNGTTTTCEALWMGVPVVTMCGDRHRARVGASLLAAVGRGEWIASDEDAYVGIATSLAGDRAKLGELRRTLRAQVSGSGLCDAAGFARRFEEAIWRAWRGG